jgi:hypothetical protein
MLKPVCVPCRRFFRVEEVGFVFTESMPAVRGAPPGNTAPEKWTPYKIWAGDLWKCPGCGATIVIGSGARPISEHFEPDFGEKAKRYGDDQLRINDLLIRLMGILRIGVLPTYGVESESGGVEHRRRNALSVTDGSADP